MKPLYCIIAYSRGTHHNEHCCDLVAGFFAVSAKRSTRMLCRAGNSFARQHKARLAGIWP